jgi:hypothetical protein
MRERADGARAALGALDLARPTAPPGLRLVPAVARDPYLGSVTAGRYYAERDRHGSPAWPVAAIAAGPLEARRVADSVLVAAARARLVRAPVRARSAGCRAVTTSDTALPPGGATVTNLGTAAVALGLRRFAPAGDAVPIGELHARAAARIELPPAPWHLTAAGAPRLQLCGA